MNFTSSESNDKSKLIELYNEYRLKDKAFLFILHVSYKEAYENYTDYFTNCVLLELNCDHLMTFAKLTKAVIYSLYSDKIQLYQYDKSISQDKSKIVKAIYCCINEKRTHIPYFIDKIYYLIGCNFNLKNILQIDTHYFFLFAEKSLAQNTLCALLVQGGIGDIFIQIPIMDYILNRKSTDISIILVENRGIISTISIFIENFKVIPINELSITFKCLTKIIRNLNCIISELHKIPEEIITASSYKQSMFENICYNSIDDKREDLPQYVFHTFLMNNQYTLPPIPEWNTISQRHTTIICLQRISDLNKEWPLEQARPFIMECHKHDITVINIAPGETQKELYDYDFSLYPIHIILSLLKYVDAFVGIDSCFGHACALLQKNSLTFFQSNDEYCRKLSLAFIPISKNYSIIPRDFACKDIPYDQAFNCLYKILKGSIQTHQGFLGFHERKENIDYEWS